MPGTRPRDEQRRRRPRRATPPVEEVEVTDLLLVVDLTDEVLVVDEHPRYHLSGCPHLAGVESFPLPVDEARTDGFTPCAVCAPDRTLAERARGRRAGRRDELTGSAGAPGLRDPAAGSPPGPRSPSPGPVPPACSRRRQHLAGQRLGVLGEGLGERAVGGPPQLDPVADLQAGALAGLLDQPDDLADQARPARSSGVRVEVQGDGEPAGRWPPSSPRAGSR